MGDHQHRAPEAPDILLQPLRGVKVQVVGGLVQQQDIRVLQNETAQVDPGLLAAGETGELLLPHGLGDGQAVGHLVDGHVRVVSAEGLESLVQSAVPPQDGRVALSRRHSGGQFLHLRRQIVEPGEGGAQHILHRIALGVHGDLGDQPQTAALSHHHGALVPVQLPGQDLEQGGLARAVPAQKSHPLALVDLKGQSVQDILSDFKGLYQPFDLYLDHTFLLN